MKFLFCHTTLLLSHKLFGSKFQNGTNREITYSELQLNGTILWYNEKGRTAGSFSELPGWGTLGL